MAIFMVPMPPVWCEQSKRLRALLSFRSPRLILALFHREGEELGRSDDAGARKTDKDEDGAREEEEAHNDGDDDEDEGGEFKARSCNACRSGTAGGGRGRIEEKARPG